MRNRNSNRLKLKMKKQVKTSKQNDEQKELILNKIISKKYNEFDNFLKGLDFKTFSHNILYKNINKLR